MDTGKPSLEKDTELVSWTNSTKLDDASKLETTFLSLKGIRQIIISDRFYCQQNRTVCFRVKNAGCVDKFKTIRSWCHFCIHPTPNCENQLSSNSGSCKNSTSRVTDLCAARNHTSFLAGQSFSPNFCPISEVDFSRKISVQFCPNLSSISAQFQDARCIFLL